MKILSLLLLAFFLAGCEEAGFTVSYSKPPGAQVGQITLTTNLAGDDLPAGTVSVQLRGLDSEGRAVYEPPDLPIQGKIILPNVPATVQSVQVRALDANGQALREEALEVKPETP